MTSPKLFQGIFLLSIALALTACAPLGKGSAASAPASAANLPARCGTQPFTGMCKAYFKRFYFNAEQGRCLPFVYGGCGGGSIIQDSFSSQAECEKTCVLAGH